MKSIPQHVPHTCCHGQMCRFYTCIFIPVLTLYLAGKFFSFHLSWPNCMIEWYCFHYFIRNSLVALLGDPSWFTWSKNWSQHISPTGEVSYLALTKKLEEEDPPRSTWYKFFVGGPLPPGSWLGNLPNRRTSLDGWCDQSWNTNTAGMI